MPRRYKSPDRFLQGDPRYGSKLVTKFVNCLMHEGKKSKAFKIFYAAMDEVDRRIKDNEPLEVFNRAVNNVKPLIEVASKRVGGATYQVPREVEKKRALALAIRWILNAVRDKKGKPTYLRLADEICAAYRKEGAAITKRETVHKMAEANKAFSHFSW
ncbi:MAG: 30S ribosomal protein S7 [Planctomycetota bacterium]|nr:MAG: 30S ribosomal protein S7 [Planctomycetota bacterium]